MDLSNSSFTDMAFAQQRSGQQDAADARLLVRFENRPIQNPEKSAAEGRPICEEQEYITIMVPGDRDNVVVRPLTDLDKQRFARQYAHWKQTGQESVSGTPLEAWPAVSRSQVEELKYFGVRTVEQLANISDQHSQKFAGIQSLKQKAQAFLAAAAGGAPLEKMQAALDALTNENATLKKMVEDQGKMLDKLQKKL